MTDPATTFANVRDLAASASNDPRRPTNTYLLDVMWVLYDRVLRVSPDRVDDPDRDRLLLSKGHGPISFYAVLAAKGFIAPDALATIGAADSPLGGHPDRLRVPGVEISSGSLGHGLPIGVGVALGLRAQGLDRPHVFVVVGDGELDEGSNHEAIAYAGAAGVGLTVVVADNASATHGWPGGIASRFTVAGWTADTVDASDHDRLAAVLSVRPADRPHAVVAASRGARR